MLDWLGGFGIWGLLLLGIVGYWIWQQFVA